MKRIFLIEWSPKLFAQTLALYSLKPLMMDILRSKRGPERTSNPIINLGTRAALLSALVTTAVACEGSGGGFDCPDIICGGTDDGNESTGNNSSVDDTGGNESGSEPGTCLGDFRPNWFVSSACNKYPLMGPLAEHPEVIEKPTDALEALLKYDYVFEPGAYMWEISYPQPGVEGLDFSYTWIRNNNGINSGDPGNEFENDFIIPQEESLDGTYTVGVQVGCSGTPGFHEVEFTNQLGLSVPIMQTEVVLHDNEAFIYARIDDGEVDPGQIITGRWKSASDCGGILGYLENNPENPSDSTSTGSTGDNDSSTGSADSTGGDSSDSSGSGSSSSTGSGTSGGEEGMNPSLTEENVINTLSPIVNSVPNTENGNRVHKVGFLAVPQ